MGYYYSKGFLLFAELAGPAAKKSRPSLFDHYSNSPTRPNTSAESGKRREKQLQLYIETINSTLFCGQNAKLSDFVRKSEFNLLSNLFERVLCAPASSAPVERVFSQSGLFLRPNRCRMTDKVLEHLVFLRCNE